MDKMTDVPDHKLVSDFKYMRDDASQGEILSRLARVSELEKEVENWKQTAGLEADGLESWKKSYEKLEQQISELQQQIFEYSPVVHISEPPLPRKDKRRKSTEKQNWKAIQQEHGRKR